MVESRSVNKHNNVSIFQPEEKDKPRELLVALTSDRGLCGGIHSSICKRIKNEIGQRSDSDPEGVGIICVGDKSRAQLARDYATNHILARSCY